MAANDDIFILRAKIDDLAIKTHQLSLKLPKSERHVLAADLRSVVNNIIRYEVQASFMQGSEARRRLRPEETFRLLCLMDAEVGLLKRKIQQTYNLGYVPTHISQRQHAEWTGLTSEVGALLGSWLKTVEGRCYRPGPQRQGTLI
ncbi:MAG: four helix bundle protein [Desulfovibrio sp.]|nr:four helix bundle protein [Desulfovibrio sp.]